MKSNRTIYTLLLAAFILSILSLSCRTTVKTAVSCPDITVKKSDFRVNHKKRNINIFIAHKTTSKNRRIHASKQARREEVKLPVTAEAYRELPVSKIEFNKSLTASADNSIRPLVTHSSPLLSIESNDPQETKCDTILLKSGATLIGKVDEIGQGEIKYRKCNNLTGPVISILKSDVSVIHYSNGTDERFDPSDVYVPNATYSNAQKPEYTQVNSPFYRPEPAKTDGFAIAGFVAGLAGLFIAGLPLGIVALIFGSISLSKIKRSPGRRGRGLAIAALILGIVDIIGVLIYLSSLAAKA
ncbi:MAG TPA: DUF4190 domain-containing protein [Bacteroidales bacterium]|nr:DUF4190 domain-containing protein [Bacteroidales bacterium]